MSDDNNYIEKPIYPIGERVARIEAKLDDGNQLLRSILAKISNIERTQASTETRLSMVELALNGRENGPPGLIREVAALSEIAKRNAGSKDIFWKLLTGGAAAGVILEGIRTFFDFHTH